MHSTMHNEAQNYVQCVHKSEVIETMQVRVKVYKQYNNMTNYVNMHKPTLI